MPSLKKQARMMGHITGAARAGHVPHRIIARRQVDFQATVNPWPIIRAALVSWLTIGGIIATLATIATGCGLLAIGGGM